MPENLPMEMLWKRYRAKRLDPGDAGKEAAYRASLEMYLAAIHPAHSSHAEVQVTRTLVERWHSEVAPGKPGKEL